MNKKTRFVVYAAVIAALYVVLTLVAASFDLASYEVQMRLSEALCILPIFTPAAIPGLFIGCLLSNIIAGAGPWDIAFGPIATLIGAVGTYLLRKIALSKKWTVLLASVPPIVANALIIPFVLAYSIDAKFSIPMLILTVGLGEVIACGVFGTALAFVLKKYGKRIGLETGEQENKEAKEESK
ncbi:MAG: QueT transporter family protein [Clostridia bacterium]|nr:QueT transporter family protein [Clostridia bacterium]